MVSGLIHSEGDGERSLLVSCDPRGRPAECPNAGPPKCPPPKPSPGMPFSDRNSSRSTYWNKSLQSRGSLISQRSPPICSFKLLRPAVEFVMKWGRITVYVCAQLFNKQTLPCHYNHFGFIHILLYYVYDCFNNYHQYIKFYLRNGIS